MALTRLGVYLFASLLLPVTVALASPTQLHTDITPDREIVPVDAPEIPLWKSYWDAGREFAREGRYGIAAEYYKELVLRKPQIEEAKWEYCKILFKLEEYEVAAPMLESLIENNPYRDEYLYTGGLVALKTGEFNRAIKYLGQIYARSPEGTQGVEALSGMVEALQRLGRHKQSFVLMEQLLQRNPRNRLLHHELAKTAFKLGDSEKSIQYYHMLLDGDDLETSTLQEAAEVFLALGQGAQAAEVWKRLLESDPGNVLYHKRMHQYYTGTDQTSKALPHILAILEHDRFFEPSFLLSAARIYKNSLKRSDKSLRYFERYIKLVPGDTRVVNELQEARREVAANLLAIVENDGAAILWDDLEKVTENRLVLYQFMAEELERSNNREALIDLLKVLFSKSRDNTKAAIRLSELFRERGEKEESYTYLNTVKDESKLTATILREKATLELSLGKEIEAFHTMKAAWEKDSAAEGVYLHLLELAGQLGMLEELLTIGQPLVTRSLVKEQFDLYLKYIEGLVWNGQHALADTLYARMLNTDWADKTVRGSILLHRAQSQLKTQSTFGAERILRSLLVEGTERDETLIQLLDHAIVSNSIEDGWALFRYSLSELQVTNWPKSTDPLSRRLFSSYIGLLEAEKEYDTAAEELRSYLIEQKRLGGDGNIEQLGELNRKLCTLYIVDDEFDKCQSWLENLRPDAKSYAYTVLAEKIITSGGKLNLKDWEATVRGDTGLSVGGLFYLAEEAYAMKQIPAALVLYDYLVDLNPDSIRARIGKAEMLKYLGRVDEAAAIYNALHLSYPDETTLYKAYLELEFRKGNYGLIQEQLTDERLHFLPIEFKLLRTRSFWAMSKYKIALLSYKELLNPPVVSIFKQRLAEKKLDYNWEDADKRTFWNMFSSHQSDQLERLNSLTDQNGFLEYLNTPIGEIAADLYEKYRWEKLIRSEYLVRKAVEDNKYITAEKNFLKQANKEGDHTAESLKDLARIYERLGDYGKEAEIYNYLRERGEMSPLLDEQIKRNELSRAPSLGMQYGYSKRDGREGAINIDKEVLGPELRFYPGLKSALILNYNEINYGQAEGEQTLDGKKIEGTLRYDSGGSTSMILALGYHHLDSLNESTILADLEVEYAFDDLLTGYFRYQEDVVDDTIESLSSGIVSRSLTGGLFLEGDSGFTLGTDYRRRWYSDDNTQDRIFFWTAYSIFSEFTNVEVKYSYELYSNRYDGLGIEDTEVVDSGELAVEEEGVRPPYWSPDDYWQHLLTVRFQHLLRQLDVFREAPSYYSVNLSVGYESSEVFSYSGGFDIFLEMSSNFLLKGGLQYSTSEELNEQSVGVSLMYRW